MITGSFPDDEPAPNTRAFQDAKEAYKAYLKSLSNATTFYPFPTNPTAFYPFSTKTPDKNTALMKPKTLAQSLINHIVFVLDESGSMSHLSKTVIDVFDAQIKNLALRSKEMDQETRVSVYTFSNSVKCLIYDKDVLRLPSIASFYNPGGGTALRDGVAKAIEDLRKTPELYGDHAFLVFVQTDGEENASREISEKDFRNLILGLPDNYTVAALVPDQRSVHYAKGAGIPAQNIQVWNTDARGAEDAGKTVTLSMDTYMQNRSTGTRSTKNLFSPNVANLSPTAVVANLEAIDAATYEVLIVRKKEAIKGFVESWTKKPYVIGSGYYELNKPEIIQAKKQILLRDKNNGKVYGGDNARQLIGLPAYDVKVAPADHKKFEIFVQSGSVNRNLVPGTNLIVLK